MFSSRLTSVTFLADPSAGGGLPRGTFIYATSPVPIQVSTSQWNALPSQFDRRIIVKVVCTKMSTSSFHFFFLFLKAPSFYWEIEIVSYGDSEEDSGPIVSFGFATEAEKRDGAWTNPVGTCLFHKYVHIKSEKLHLFSLCSVSDLIADCYSLLCHSVFVRLSPVCLSVCVSNGRAVHYNGSSLLQWKSVRLDVALLPGEIGVYICFSTFTIYSLFYFA